MVNYKVLQQSYVIQRTHTTDFHQYRDDEESYVQRSHDYVERNRGQSVEDQEQTVGGLHKFSAGVSIESCHGAAV